MFVRRKRNPTGVVSVQIIDKSGGRYKVYRTVGSSSDPEEVERFFREGKEWIHSFGGQLELFALEEKEKQSQLEIAEMSRVLGKIDRI